MLEIDASSNLMADIVDKVCSHNNVAVAVGLNCENCPNDCDPSFD